MAAGASYSCSPVSAFRIDVRLPRWRALPCMDSMSCDVASCNSYATFTSRSMSSSVNLRAFDSWPSNSLARRIFALSPAARPTSFLFCFFCFASRAASCQNWSDESARAISETCTRRGIKWICVVREPRAQQVATHQTRLSVHVAADKAAGTRKGRARSGKL